MLLMTIILLAAALVGYALYRKRDVTFNVKVLGAHVLLEARGDQTRGDQTTEHADKNPR